MSEEGRSRWERRKGSNHRHERETSDECEDLGTEDLFGDIGHAFAHAAEAAGEGVEHVIEVVKEKVGLSESDSSDEEPDSDITHTTPTPPPKKKAHRKKKGASAPKPPTTSNDEIDIDTAYQIYLEELEIETRQANLADRKAGRQPDLVSGVPRRVPMSSVPPTLDEVKRFTIAKLLLAAAHLEILNETLVKAHHSEIAEAVHKDLLDRKSISIEDAIAGKKSAFSPPAPPRSPAHPTPPPSGGTGGIRPMSTPSAGSPPPAAPTTPPPAAPPARPRIDFNSYRGSLWSDASQDLRSQGADVAIERRNHDSVPIDRVIGGRVESGRAILSVSDGPAAAAPPPASSGGGSSGGTPVSSTPPATPAAPVAAPKPKLKVPDFVGRKMTDDSVQNDLFTHQFAHKAEAEGNDPSKADGEILAQIPPKDTEFEAGSPPELKFRVNKLPSDAPAATPPPGEAPKEKAGGFFQKVLKDFKDNYGI